ncbi:MAG: S41 family peptidase [Pyrinomonadaceae bacterium]|nr:S41 family peptidase [Phycisphaerales bacterium]
MKTSRILPLGLIVSLVGGVPALSGPALAGAAWAQPDSVKLPDTNAARCAAAFIAVVNKPEAEAVKAFEEKFGSAKRRAAVGGDERARRIKALHEEWGDATITRVADSSGGGITLILMSARLGALEAEFRFDPAEPGKLEAIMIQNAAESTPLTREVRASTVQAAAKALEQAYVYPEVATKMAETILAKLEGGAYDSIADEAALARRLTEDLQAVSKDKHLRVALSPSQAQTEAPVAMMPSRDEMRKHNFGFKKTEVLDGNVGYLRFDVFVEDEEANKTATAALGFLANCDALIFDLRQNGGGSPEMIRFITSYLFDEPTHLNDMMDREGKVVEEYWTLKDVPGKRFPSSLPVYVLTSSRTFSGAEEFSYNLKHLKRATIVGETTGGGAHPVRGERLNNRFLMRVPYMRANNPISKTNWEGTGVEPDIKAPAAEALERALEAIRTSRGMLDK